VPVPINGEQDRCENRLAVRTFYDGNTNDDDDDAMTTTYDMDDDASDDSN
jgi:hypothetical protein